VVWSGVHLSGVVCFGVELRGVMHMMWSAKRCGVECQAVRCGVPSGAVHRCGVEWSVA
jgi:hypothetical protein